MRTRLVALLSISLFVFGCSNKSVKSETQQVKVQSQTTTGPVANSKSATASEVVKRDANLICNRGQESRTLKIKSENKKSCELFYSTHSKDKPVAWSSNGEQHCVKIRDQIRGNLEKAQFNCVQEVISSVTNLDEPAPQNKK